MSDGAIRKLLGYVHRHADADPGTASDDRLLTRYVESRDEAAFELLVWRHAGLVFGVCRRVLGDSHTAEDAFQATFLALARKARAIRRAESLAGWLHRVARRIASRARTSAVRRMLVERRAAGAVAVTTDNGSLADVRAVVDEEVNRLPERLRRAVVLCYLEGLTTDEAARRLGCPGGTVKSRLAAARERLRGRLTRRGLGIPAAGLAAVFVPTTAPGGLIAPAVRASLAYAAGTVAAAEVAPRVIGWADGVIRAMMLTKLKFAAGVVLAVGMLGGSGAWFAAPGLAPTALAEPPQGEPQRPTERQRNDNETTQRDENEIKRAEKEREKQLNEAEHRIQLAEHQLLTTERNSIRAEIEARLRFAAAQDSLKQAQHDLENAPGNSPEFQAIMEQISDRNATLSPIQAKMGKDDPVAKKLRDEIAALENRLDAVRKDVFGKAQREVDARHRDVIDWEIELKVTEQRVSLERARQQKRLDVLDERWRALARPRGEARDRESIWEQKFDALLREVRELRREMKK